MEWCTLTAMRVRIDWEEVLEIFLFALDKFSRPTFNNLVASFEESRYRSHGPKLFFQLERERFIRQQERRGEAEFVVAEACRRPRVEGRDPMDGWEAPWDGRWRLLTFDVPTRRNPDRLKLWRQLRARRVGFVQQSVCIWPHDMKPMLVDILEATGIPECFAGFEADRLFLCENREIVAAAWDFDTIMASHRAYLAQVRGFHSALARMQGLSRFQDVGRAEWKAYQKAMSKDPFLPKPLLPRGYLGKRVCEEHQAFRSDFGRRLGQLLST